MCILIFIFFDKIASFLKFIKVQNMCVSTFNLNRVWFTQICNVFLRHFFKRLPLKKFYQKVQYHMLFHLTRSFF